MAKGKNIRFFYIAVNIKFRKLFLFSIIPYTQKMSQKRLLQILIRERNLFLIGLAGLGLKGKKYTL